MASAGIAGVICRPPGLERQSPRLLRRPLQKGKRNQALLGFLRPATLRIRPDRFLEGELRFIEERILLSGIAQIEPCLGAREKAGYSSSPRILGVYHIYVGEDGVEARASGANGVKQYSNAAASSHSLTPNVEEPASYHSHFAAREAMRKLSFDELIDGNRVLIGSAAEVRGQLQFLHEQLYLTDVAGLFALEGLTDTQTRRSMRRFMAEVTPGL